MKMTIQKVKALIPYIEWMKDNPNFPDGYCDVVTAQICRIDKVKDTTAVCGTMEEMQHFWVKQKGVNIDFTASQFKSLIPHLRNVNDYTVIYGNDEYFTSLGYKTTTSGLCEEQLKSAVTSINMNELNILHD